MRNKKTLIAIISVIAVVLVLIGVTYAYWLVTKEQQGENVISSACLDISLNGSNDITLPDQYPMSDEDGLSTEAYTFTVINNCKTSIDYQVNLETLGNEDNTIIPSAIKVALNNDVSLLTNKIEVTPTISDAYTARKLLVGTLAGSSDETTEDTVTYELRLWIDQDAPISEQNKTFTSKITVTVGQKVITAIKEGTLAYDILSNYGGASAITEITDFTNAPASGVYKTEDDLGISYYLRNIDNNYVKLGEAANDSIQGVYLYLNVESNIHEGPFDSLSECETYREEQIEIGAPEELTCKNYEGLVYASYLWRILRINGDNTIRLVFAGVNDMENNYQYLPSISNDYSYEIDDPKYVEFTYNIDGVEKDSHAKDSLESFYSTYLGAEYDKYIADGIFCNDRNIVRTNGEEIYYAAYDRITNEKPSLICTNKSDRYTVNKNIGNGLLSKPIGLITADEMFFSSYFNYVYGGGIRTMTPSSYSEYAVDEFSPSFAAYTYSFDGMAIEQIPVYVSAMEILPVINLKANVKFTGNGSYETPYEIVLN